MDNIDNFDVEYCKLVNKNFEINYAELNDKEDRELLNRKSKMTSEEYNKDRINLLRRQNQRDVDLIDEMEKIVKEEYHDRPLFKKRFDEHLSEFREFTVYSKELIDRVDPGLQINLKIYK